LLLVTACAGPSASTAPTPGGEDLAAADRAAYEATIARLEGEVRAAFDREARLRSQLDDLRLDAGDAGSCGEPKTVTHLPPPLVRAS